MLNILVPGCALAVLGAVALAGEEETEAQIAAHFLAGVWSEASHHAEASETRESPGALYAVFHVIDPPPAGDAAVYAEWRSGAPDGPVSRQHVWVFHGGYEEALQGMDVYALREPHLYEGRSGDDPAFASLSGDALIASPESCHLAAVESTSRSFLLETDGDTCRMPGTEGDGAALAVRLELSFMEMRYRETGHRETGTQDADYRFERGWN